MRAAHLDGLPRDARVPSPHDHDASHEEVLGHTAAKPSTKPTAKSAAKPAARMTLDETMRALEKAGSQDLQAARNPSRTPWY